MSNPTVAIRGRSTPESGSVSRRRHARARRLVESKALDRAAWLDTRKRGIGSSDAAAAVGLNPYKSQLELWMEKTDRDVKTPEADNAEGLDSPLHWGTVLEPVVAWHYAKRTGHRVRRVNAILQHPDHNWMLANLDREVLGSPDVQVLECKTAGIHGAKLWRDGVPEYVQLQVMHQLAVTGQYAADVAVLLGGQSLEIHRLERDEALIERLIALERDFWRYVETDTPPPADGSRSAGEALRNLYPKDNGTVLDGAEDASLCHAFDELLEVRQRLETAKQQEAQLKHRLQQAMGEATFARFPNGSLTWKQASETSRVDLKQLQQDHPELCARYLRSVPGTRRFVVRS